LVKHGIKKKGGMLHKKNAEGGKKRPNSPINKKPDLTGGVGVSSTKKKKREVF